ncbi:MAG: hypothetical protein A2Y40_04575 [Candidatus Margulisbacteria bacterium GWF2_35_9]|nr:MAG: hypothetical protein A2Y40_04575 [Candidatus Margulisbacteria bacterium GWF2_35_9]
MLNRSLKKQSNDDQEEEGGWILTFSDMMTLLLAFFVLLYSMSKIDTDKYQGIVESLKSTLTGAVTTEKPQGHIIQDTDLKVEAENIENLNNVLEKEMKDILNQINEFIAVNNLSSKINAFSNQDGVVVKIADDVLFNSGEAEFNPDSKVLLNYLVELVHRFPYPIRVEGHTDNRPINTDKFPSNWELSTIRACNVIRYFIEKGLNPRLFSAEGFAEFRPIGDNNTDSGRSKNRRVELIYKKERIMDIFRGNN